MTMFIPHMGMAARSLGGRNVQRASFGPRRRCLGCLGSDVLSHEVLCEVTEAIIDLILCGQPSASLLRTTVRRRPFQFTVEAGSRGKRCPARPGRTSRFRYMPPAQASHFVGFGHAQDCCKCTGVCGHSCYKIMTFDFGTDSFIEVHMCTSIKMVHLWYTCVPR